MFLSDYNSPICLSWLWGRLLLGTDWAMHSLRVTAHVLDLDGLSLVLIHGCVALLLLLRSRLSYGRCISVIEELVCLHLLAVMHSVSASVVTHNAWLFRHVAKVVGVFVRGSNYLVLSVKVVGVWNQNLMTNCKLGISLLSWFWLAILLVELCIGRVNLLRNVLHSLDDMLRWTLVCDWLAPLVNQG